LFTVSNSVLNINTFEKLKLKHAIPKKKIKNNNKENYQFYSKFIKMQTA
jgi:hypothetical protein